MNFNARQKEHIKIAAQIWLAGWSGVIVADYEQRTHRLGVAKEELKSLICPTNNFEVFTEKEVDEICYIIGDWYFNWKDKYIDYQNKRHNLSDAVNDLLQIFGCNVEDGFIEGEFHVINENRLPVLGNSIKDAGK